MECTPTLIASSIRGLGPLPAQPQGQQGLSGRQGLELPCHGRNVGLRQDAHFEEEGGAPERKYMRGVARCTDQPRHQLARTAHGRKEEEDGSQEQPEATGQGSVAPKQKQELGKSG